MRFCAKVKNAKLGTVKNYVGMPPEITGGVDKRKLLPPADVLLIEAKEDGIYLYRITKEGKFINDTWHKTLDEAKQQAKTEFDNDPGRWKNVPDAYSDQEIVNLACRDE